MNSWLRNIQGQLTELATEVLQEATVEVEDPETELQVERKKCAEAERLLLVEKSKSESLEKRVVDLEEQLYTASLENEAIREKFEKTIANKEQEYELFKSKLQRNESAFQNIDLDEKTFVSTSNDSENSENRKFSRDAAQLKEKHEAEISALMAVHNDNIQQIREDYERKIQDLQNWGTSSVAFNDDEKYMAHEREIAELKSALEAVHEENQKTITELKAQLLEKEAELHKIHECYPVMEDDEKRPPSIAGTDSAGSNGGWERMGAEDLGGVRVAPSSNSSSCSASASGDNIRGKKDTTLTGQQVSALDVSVISQHEIEDNKLLVESLEEKLLISNSELQICKDDLDRKCGELQEQKDLCNKLQKSLQLKEDELRTKQAATNELEEQFCSKLSDSDTSLKTLLSDYKEQEAKFSALVKELSSTSSTLKIVQADNVTLQSNLDTLEFEFAEAKASTEKYSLLNESLSKEKNEKDICSQQLIEQNNALQLEITNLSQHLFALSSELNSLRLRNDDLSSDVQKISNELDESNTKMLECKASYDSLLERKNENDVLYQNALNKINSLENDICQRDSSLPFEESNIAALSEDLSAASSALEHLREEKMALSNEVEKLRVDLAQLDNLYKEQLERNNALEQEVSQKSNISEEKENEIMLMKEQLLATIENLQHENKRLSSELECLNVAIVESDSRLTEYSNSYNNVLKEKEANYELYQQTFNRVQSLEKEFHELKDSSNTQINLDEFTKLRTESMNLQRLLADSQSVSENYVKNLEQLSSDIQTKQERLNTTENELDLLKQRLSASEKEYERDKKELYRLREHLVTMEEISTKEAIMAEERETQLRDEIRMLQNKTQTVSENANQSQNQYQEEIILLKEQLVASEENNAKFRSILEERERSLIESTKALSNLQEVLRELGDDHSQEIKNFENQIQLLKKENESVHEKIKIFSEKESTIIEDRRYLEDSVTLLKEELDRKNIVIEELENQMEELRHVGCSTESVEGGNPLSTYKIDDATLKQLFLSYFLADKEKQPEIASVMCSILGYSVEDQTAVQNAVNRLHDGSGGWFRFLARRSGINKNNNSNNQAPSLAEQFIRFLESESRELSEQPTLPVQSDMTASGGGQLMLEDVTSLPITDHQILHNKYSSSDLKDILES